MTNQLKMHSLLQIHSFIQLECSLPITHVSSAGFVLVSHISYRADNSRTLLGRATQSVVLALDFPYAPFCLRVISPKCIDFPHTLNLAHTLHCSSTLTSAFPSRLHKPKSYVPYPGPKLCPGSPQAMFSSNLILSCIGGLYVSTNTLDLSQ